MLWSSSLSTGVTIGLEVSETSILESGGSVDAIIKLLHGNVSSRVTVALSTVEQSAKGELHVVHDGTGVYTMHIACFYHYFLLLFCRKVLQGNFNNT